MERFLVTGVSGFLGSNFCHFFGSKIELHGTYNTNPVNFPGVKTYQCNLIDKNSAWELVRRIKPEGIIHLAAISDPNYCETHPGESYEANVTAPTQLAEIAAEEGIPFLAASTDLVFDGKHAPYQESDPAVPVSTYGRHKLEMEYKVMAIYPKAVIARLPLMYGAAYANGKSFLQPMLKKLAAGEEIILFTDEYRTVASARDICRGMLICLAKGKGIYQLGGNERLSRFDFGKTVCQAWGYDQGLLIPALQKDVSMPAARPADVSLDNRRAKALGWLPNSLSNELGYLYNTEYAEKEI